MNLLAQAKKLGAVINSSSLCLPARSLVQFLNIATSAGYEIRYVECLYFHEADGAPAGGTEPGSNLSRDFVPGRSIDVFIAEVGRLAGMAIESAAKRNIRPFYQVGLEPELEPGESDILVRR